MESLGGCDFLDNHLSFFFMEGAFPFIIVRLHRHEEQKIFGFRINVSCSACVLDMETRELQLL
jgi:hypothetical protein